jgi:hypothetical protein
MDENVDRELVRLGIRKIIWDLIPRTSDEQVVVAIEQELSERLTLGFVENLGDLYAQIVVSINEINALVALDVPLKEVK